MRQKPSAFACLVLATLCLAGPVHAQLPRQSRLDTFSQIRHHLRTGRFARTVTVSPSGGDYTEPDAACTYVAGQTRSATVTWLVLIYPGNYSTDCAGAPVATPTFTTLHRYDDLDLALLATTGTPDATNFLRGDGAWTVIPPPGGSPYNRVVIVDPGGGGDYLTVEEAVAFVTTQVRSTTARWVIEIEPGPSYAIATAPLAVPTYTTLSGKITHSILLTGAQVTLSSPSMSSGSFITLDTGSALSHLNVSFSGTLTGPAKIVEIIGGSVALLNVQITNNASAATQPITMVETTTAATTAVTVYYNNWQSFATATNLTYFKHQNAGSTYVIDTLAGSNTGAVAILHNTSTGNISVIRSSLGRYYSTNSDPNTCSLRNDSTGRIEPTQTAYWAPTCGAGTAIDDWHFITRVRTFVGTPFATCSPTPSEIALDLGTPKRVCLCVAADDWDCAELTP